MLSAMEFSGNRKNISIRSWMLRMVFAGLLIAAVMVLAVPWYAGTEMRRQAREANETLSEVYLEALDSNVEGINKLLSQYAADTYDVSVLARSTDELERYMAKRNIMQKLEDASIIYNVFDGIFVRSDSSIEDIFLCQVGPKGSGRQVEDMKTIMDGFSETYSANRWELIFHEGKNYLVRVVVSGSTSCGAWIDVESLSVPLDRIDFGKEGSVLFLEQSGVVLNDTKGRLTGITALDARKNGSVIRAAGKRYLQIVKPSRYLPIAMAILIPEADYLGNIYAVQNVIGILMAASLLLFPVLWRTLSKSVSEPVEQLISAMNEVQKGNLSVRARTGGRFLEFEKMSSYFNDMVSEIDRLRKDVYERTISQQKIQLQYLQTQIRPHFFLNTLNVIYSFSLVRRNDLIEEMVSCLSKYFSYRFKSTDSFVSLGEEKEHIENYLKLHRLRYQNQFLFHLEIEEVLLDAKLPPLVIQTFVENSLKYGVTQEQVFELELVAETLTEEGEQKLKITVTDNGPGYDAEILAAVAQGKTIEKGGSPSAEKSGQGIGINNVIQRLRLIYQDRARVRLFNIQGQGACSEIILPLSFMEEES